MSQMIRGSINQKIVSEWKKHDNGQIEKMQNQFERRKAKALIYSKISETLSVEFANHKDPRSMIRRVVNTEIFGYKPKKIIQQE